MTHNVRALFLSIAHDLPKTPALLKRILTDIQTLEAALQSGNSGEEMPTVHRCVQQLLEIECPVKRDAYKVCMRFEIEAKIESAKKVACIGTDAMQCVLSCESSVWSSCRFVSRVWIVH